MMVSQTMLDRFSMETPVTVMVRASLENLLSPERLDRVFTQNAVRQKCGELLFSTVADLMVTVVLKIKPSVSAAYQAREHEIAVSLTSIYNKLNGIETAVSRALVKDTAQAMMPVIKAMKNSTPSPLLPGYRTRIIDGNHLAGTEHRIEELRRLGAAALPGHSLVVLDPDYRMILDTIPCEDAHAQERTLFPQLLEQVQAGDVWIQDRNFCTQAMLFGIALDCRANFITRHHLGNVPSWKAIGRQKKMGLTDNGVIYEQAIELTDKRGRTLRLRRITVKLDTPTRHGETEVHLLTNLPKRVSAKKISQAYRCRWKIETAFQELAEVLESEIETLGYPKAALFAFSLSLIAYNVLSVIKAALSAAHGVERVENEVSSYYLGLEISGSWKGLQIAVPPEQWTDAFVDLSPAQLGRKLVQLAKHVRLRAFRKHPRGPKKPPPKRKSGNRGNHVATAQIIAKRKQPVKA